MNRVITYIDGFNFYYGLRSKGWKRFYWMNLSLLASNLLRSGQQLEKVKYFTSRVSSTPKDPQKDRRQARFLDALATCPDLELYYGHYLSKKVRCFSCGAEWDTYEEKMTDVNIAVHLLQDAHEDNFDTAMVISGDSDLSGPIEMIRSRFASKRIVIAFPPSRNSLQLKRVAHAHFVIGRQKLRHSLLPDPVVLSNGVSLNKPPNWN